MILIEKKRRPKFLQAGGGIGILMGAGEDPVQMQLATPGFADTLQASPAPRRPTGAYGGRGKGSRTGMQTQIGAGGFESDKAYAFGKRTEVMNRISERTAQNGDNYLGSPEYANDQLELQQVVQMIAGLKDKKKQFTETLSGKKMNANELAIFGEVALVQDSVGEKDLVNIYEAIKNPQQYKILNLGQARLARATDIKFNGFEDLGQQLESLIVSTPDKGELDKQVNTAFKSAGVTMRDSETLVFPGGETVNILNFADYLSAYDKPFDTLDGTMQKMIENNGQQLESALGYLAETIYARPELHSAYRNQAIGTIIQSGYDLSKVDDEQMEGLIDQTILKNLGSKMQIFVKNQFKDSFDQARKKKDEKEEGADSEKITINLPKFIVNMALPTNLEQHEFKSSFRGKSNILMASGSEITSSLFIENGWNEEGTKDNPLKRDTKNNLNLTTLIHGNVANSLKIAGTEEYVSDQEDGEVLNSGIIARDSDIVILQNMPMKKGARGEWTVAHEYVEVFGDFMETLKKAVQMRKEYLEANGEVFTEDMVQGVLEDLEEQDKFNLDDHEEYQAMRKDIMNGAIEERDAVVYELLFYADDDTGGSNNPLYVELTPNEETELQDYAIDGGWWTRRLDDARKVLVIAPINTVPELKNADWKGLDTKPVKQAEFIRDVLQQRQIVQKQTVRWDVGDISQRILNALAD